MRGFGYVVALFVLFASVSALPAMDLDLDSTLEISSVNGSTIRGPFRSPASIGDPVVSLIEIESPSGEIRYTTYRQEPVRINSETLDVNSTDEGFVWAKTVMLDSDTRYRSITVRLDVPASTNVEGPGLERVNGTTAVVETAVPGTVVLTGTSTNYPGFGSTNITHTGALISANTSFTPAEANGGIELRFPSGSVSIDIDRDAIVWIIDDDGRSLAPPDTSISVVRDRPFSLEIHPFRNGTVSRMALSHLPSDPSDLIEEPRLITSAGPIEVPNSTDVAYVVNRRTRQVHTFSKAQVPVIDDDGPYDEQSGEGVRTIVAFATGRDVRAEQLAARVGEPVEWRVASTERVRIPKSAYDLRIDGTPARGEVIIDGTRIDAAAFEELQQLRETEREFIEVQKSRRFLVDAQANARYEELRNRVRDLSERVPAIATEELDAPDASAVFVANATGELRFTTPPPRMRERSVSVATRAHVPVREVVVSSDVHYENVTVRSELPEPVNTPGEVHIVWLEDPDVNIAFTLFDTDSDDRYDTVEWIAPHLSDQTFQIIVLTSGIHIDEQDGFVSDVYDDVAERDDVWSEPIPDGHAIRATFERALSATNDITIFAQPVSGTPRVDVYVEGGDTIIATFDPVQEERIMMRYLTGLTGTEDTFDLRVVGGSVSFDHIIDPPLPVSDNVTLRFDANQITGLSDGDPVASWGDLSGNGYNASQNNASLRPTYHTSGPSGSPIVRFNASNSEAMDTAFVASDTLFENGSTLFVVLETNASGQRIAGSAGDPAYAISSSGGALNTSFGNASGTGGDLSADSLRLVTLAYDGTTARAYVDGNETHTYAASFSGTSSSSFGIGHVNGSSGTLDGGIAELVVYERNLSSSERSSVESYLGEKWLGWAPPTIITFTGSTPADNTVSTSDSFVVDMTIEGASDLDSMDWDWNGTSTSFYASDLVLMYDLDNLSALGENDTHVRDVGLSSNNASVYGNAAPISGGVHDGAYTFDGTNDWLQTSATSGLGEGSSELTIMAWVRDTGGDTQPRGIVSKRFGTGSSGRSYSLFLYSGRLINFDVGSDRDTGSSSLPQGEWVHVAVTFDGSAPSEQKRFYMNGAPDGTAGSGSSVPSGSAPVHVGILNDNYGQSWEGDIDEVRIFERALSAAEIEEHYRSNLARITEANWTFTSNRTNLSEGSVTYAGDVLDNGTPHTTGTRTYAYDLTSPVVSFEDPTPAESDFVQASFVVNATVADENPHNVTVDLYNASGSLVDTATANGSNITTNFSGLGEGAYSFNATATDGAGFTSSSETRNVTVDLGFPIVSYESPTDPDLSFVSRSSVHANVSAIEANLDTINISLYANGVLVSSSQDTQSPHFANFTGLADGTYSFNATATDLAGNANTTPTREVTTDTTLPVITTYSPLNDTTYLNSTITVNFTASDENGIDERWYFNGTANVTYTAAHNVTLENDNYTFVFYANDSAGNVQQATRNFEVDTLAADEDPPTLFVNEPENTSYAESNVTLDVDVIDNVEVDTVWFFNGTDNVTYVAVTNVTLDDAHHTFVFYANDTAGNEASENVSFTVDTTYPSIQFTSPTDLDSAAYARSYVEVNVTASDTHLDEVVVELFDENGTLVNSTNSTGSLFVNFTALADGTYAFNATATDLAGNTNATETRELTLDTNAPTIGFIDPTPNSSSILTSSTIDVNVTASDANLDEVVVELFDENGTLVNSTNDSIGFLATFTGLADGTYSFNATASDVVAFTAATGTRTVEIDSSVPIVAFEPSTPADEALIYDDEARINVSITESELANATFTWNSSTASLYDDNLQLMLGFDNIGSLGESAGTAVDHSPNGYTASIVGASYTTDAIAGQSLTFSSGDRATVSSFPNASGSDTLSISAWVNQNTLSTQQYLLWADGNVLIEFGSSYGAPQGSDVLRMRWNLEGDWRNTHSIANALNSTGEWNHWLFVFDQGETRIYKNGASVYTGSDAQQSITVTSPNWNFGTRDANGFDGSIDEIRVYDRAIGDVEAAQLAATTFSRLDTDSWRIVSHQQNISEGMYTYQASAQRSNTLTGSTEERSLTINHTPDLTIGSIGFSTAQPIESDTVVVTVNVTNEGVDDVDNATLAINVSAWNGSWQHVETLVNTTVSVAGRGSTNATLDWTAGVGTYRFNATIDPNGTVEEISDSNNSDTRNFTVPSWNVIYGLADNVAKILSGTTTGFFGWNVTDVEGIVIYADADASFFVWDLEPLNGTDDLIEADVALGSTYYNDSVRRLFDTNNDSIADSTTTFTIGSRDVANVPITDSTNSSSFVTGLLWDSADGGSEYNGSQDLLVITRFNESQTGAYGTYDYEIRVPVGLETLITGTDQVQRVFDLR